MNAFCCSDPRCRIYGCLNDRGRGCTGPQIPPTQTVTWPFPVTHEPQKRPEEERIRQIVREEIERALANREAGK